MKKANKNDVLSALKTGWAESAPRPRQTPWEESHLENIRKGCDQINRYLSTDKRLYVEAALRRQGLGRALMAVAARAATAWGGSFLWWSAKNANAVAMGFYAGVGEMERDVATWACFGERFQALLKAQP